MFFNSDNLRYERRYFRVYSDKLCFGPTGDRLFVDYLEKLPGFVGRIDFIHKINLPKIFTVVADNKCDFSLSAPTWYPDRLVLRYEDNKLCFEETKFVTQDDMAVSCQKWINKTSNPVTLKLDYSIPFCSTIKTENGDIAFTTPLSTTGVSALVRIHTSVFQEDGYVIVPAESSIEFTLIAAFGNASTQVQGELREQLKSYMKTCFTTKEYIETQKNEYAHFFTSFPTFTCSDPLLQQTWLYRCYLLKNNLARPGAGNFKHYTMYEGRSHKMGKVPFQPTGWEFSRLIPLSTPLHLTELQWCGKQNLIEEIILSLLDTQVKDDLFRVMSINKIGNAYANFSVWAIYQCWLKYKNTKFIKGILPKLKRFVDTNIVMYASNNDSLQVESVHQLTGKEYQPSYWYFNNYPKDCYDKKLYTPLKRVDRSVYHYLNLCGLSRLCSVVKDSKAKNYAAKAKTIKTQINQKMWDKDHLFYYDLHYKTDKKALVKNITGFYPFWANIAPQDYLPAINNLSNPQEFATPYSFPSVSKNCPAYSASGGWMGRYMKGRDGCVWDGPSWPYTNGIILDALGLQSQHNGHQYDSLFSSTLRDYARQHFRNGDLHGPYLVEHYNPETGEPLSDEVDYNHSYFIHLVLRYIVGIETSETQVIIDPLEIGLESFKCENIIIGNHKLDVYYNRYHTGLRVLWDKIEINEFDEKGRIIIQRS